MELDNAYMNELARQFMFMSALLGGFSLTVLVLLLGSEDMDRYRSIVFRLAALATGAFLVAIFGLTDVIMKTTPGYPLAIKSEDILFARLAGGGALFVGVLTVLGMVAMMGWVKSRAMGWFTTLVSLVALIFFFLLI